MVNRQLPLTSSVQLKAFLLPILPLLKGSSTQVIHWAIVSSYISLPASLQQFVMGENGSLQVVFPMSEGYLNIH